MSELLRERHIAPVTFSRWKKIYLAGGLDALSKGNVSFENEVIKENQKLREALGTLYVELEFLKKKVAMGR